MYQITRTAMGKLNTIRAKASCSSLLNNQSNASLPKEIFACPNILSPGLMPPTKQANINDDKVHSSSEFYSYKKIVPAAWNSSYTQPEKIYEKYIGIKPNGVYFGDHGLASGARSYASTSGDHDSGNVKSFQSERVKPWVRPLSPHIALYQPQLNSTLSIFNRIAGAYLATVVLASHLICLKLGMICFTYDYFYQFLFYSSKLTLILEEIAVLAIGYHVYKGVGHLVKDFTGYMGGIKRFK